MPSATPTTPPHLTPSAWIVVAMAGLLTACLCWMLWPDWQSNPDLSHGLFAPVLFLLLLHESRRRGPFRFPEDTLIVRLTRGVALICGLVSVAMAGLFAAAVEWSHPLVGMSLALALSGLLLGALLWLSSATMRVVPLNWASFVAVAFWPLCAPFPPGLYSRITLQLQFWVTEIVLNALHLLGIAASTSGNIILLATTSVGVEEACSGVRSLVSCFFAALFFSATLVRRPWARFALIAIAPLLAFGMNVVRSLGLTLLANGGVDISGTWHDLTGFAVLGVTALMLGGLALWLEGPETPPQPAAAAPSHLATRPWGVFAAFGTAAALIVFFVANTHGPARDASPPPDLQVLLPTQPAGWDRVHTEDLYRFASVLETEHLVQRTYLRRGDAANAEPVQITLYLAYWSPGQAPVSLVAAHTPEACWPGGGWTTQPTAPITRPFASGQRFLPPPEYRAFAQASFLQHVWYWHLYDGRSITQKDPRSPLQLLKLAWNYGFRTAGEQMFVRVSSNRPWDEIHDDPLLVEILARLEPFGL